MSVSLGAHLWNRDPDSLRRRAVEVEALGFASITVGDHLGYFPPLASCAIIAEATSRVRFGPLVLNNDFRHPVVLAHEAAALADLSGGRFELGLGAGYARREYDRAGIPFAPRPLRIARLAESARILRGLLSGQTIDFDGHHYVVRDQSVPIANAVPILIGGNSPELHAVAAECADLIGLAGSATSRTSQSDYGMDAVERQVSAIQAAAHRRPTAPELHVLVQWHEETDDRPAAVRRAATALGVPVEVAEDSPYVLVGSAEEIAAQLVRHHDRLGLSRWTVFADRPDLQPAEALVPVLARLDLAERGRARA